MSSNHGHPDVGLGLQPNEFIMLNKKERILLRALLSRGLTSDAGREFIAKKLGEEYLEIGETLLDEMGGDVDLP